MALNNRIKYKLGRLDWVLKDMINELKRLSAENREELIDKLYDQLDKFDEDIEKYMPKLLNDINDEIEVQETNSKSYCDIEDEDEQE